LPVSITFAEDDHGNAALDVEAAWDAAQRAKDASGIAAIRRLLYEYVQEELQSKSPARLAAYCASRAPWRTEGDVAVYKSTDLPCVAFTALVFDGDVHLVVLGFCYRYPGDDDDWWTQVVRPRLLRLL
jgi:hypothetical protein